MLRGVEGISFVQFDERDVVRHSLVQRIVRAYEKYNETMAAGRQLTLKLGGCRLPKPAPATRTRQLRRAGTAATPEGVSCPSLPVACVVFRRVPAAVADRLRSNASRAMLRDRVAGGREFDCLITTDAELQRLNRDFRGKDYPTDVLSFPADSPQSAGLRQPPDRLRESWLAGDSCSARRRRPVSSDTPSKHEIRILMLHGVLHLLGMDHETDRGRWRARNALAAQASGSLTV